MKIFIRASPCRLGAVRRFSLAVLADGPVAPQSFRIEQKDGLTVVRNGSKPAPVPGAPKGVRLVHELTIGSENDPKRR